MSGYVIHAKVLCTKPPYSLSTCTIEDWMPSKIFWEQTSLEANETVLEPWKFLIWTWQIF